MRELTKCTILFIGLILMGFGSSIAAQSRFPITAGSVWRINYEYSDAEQGVHNNGDEVYKYFVNGDTIIQDKTYFKLYKSGVMYLESPYYIKNKYMGAIRDMQNIYYYVAKGKEAELVLYDFNAIKGDNFTYNGKADLQIDSVDTLDDGRKRFIFSFITVHCGSANTIVEGVGWLGGLLEGNSCFAHPGIRGSYTVCYSENGTTRFLSKEAIERGITTCSDIPVPILEPVQDNSKIWQTGNLLKVKCGNDLGHSVNVEIYDMLGIKVFQQKCAMQNENTINIINFKSGNYIVKLSGMSRQIISKIIKQ